MVVVELGSLRVVETLAGSGERIEMPGRDLPVVQRVFEAGHGVARRRAIGDLLALLAGSVAGPVEHRAGRFGPALVGERPGSPGAPDVEAVEHGPHPARRSDQVGQLVAFDDVGIGCEQRLEGVSQLVGVHVLSSSRIRDSAEGSRYRSV